jgi:inhibitor of cysteine peptidase
MKIKLILLCTVVALSLCLTGYGCSTEQPAVEISCDDFTADNHISRDIEVSVGDSFTVTLCSNPTTGFEWGEAEISDQAVVKQTANEFVAPEDTGVVGAPGVEVWTFEALKKGNSTVSVSYDRPWEGGEKGAWTFTLDVTVK